MNWRRVEAFVYLWTYNSLVPTVLVYSATNGGWITWVVLTVTTIATVRLEKKLNELINKVRKSSIAKMAGI